MELTLDQALQKGVEAHRAGKTRAERYYTAILKAGPNILMLILYGRSGSWRW